MSTRQESATAQAAPAAGARRWGWPAALPARATGPATAIGPASGAGDPADAVALVARARRELLLAVHRHRLTREDLEDCYSQATLELLARARRGGAFAGPKHIANALELRLLSRVHDRRRALSGRSPIEAALARAVPLGAGEAPAVSPADARVDVERTVLLRHELRRIAELARKLSADQRLVLAHRLSFEENHIQFCDTHGWSVEKYRKVSQRARARLLRLLDEESRTAPADPAASGGPVGREATPEKKMQGACPVLPHPSEERAGTHL